MGDYKGRVNLKKRRNRFAKAKQIKALAATSINPLYTPAGPNKGKSPEGKGDVPATRVPHQVEGADL